MIKFQIEEQKARSLDGELIDIPKQIWRFENTLSALKKWESVFQKAWLSGDSHTLNEINFYIKCMSIDEFTIYPELLNSNQRTAIMEYLQNPMGAHKLPKSDKKGPRIIYTAELIYAYCILNRIDLNWAEKQNLNQLLTIIGVVGALQEPEKPITKSDLSRRMALNKSRRDSLKTKG